MRRKLVILSLLVVLVCLCTGAALVEQEQRSLADRLIRLHVVANSDTAEDQARKLEVRDALLPRITALTEGCHTQSEAEQQLRQNLAALQDTAAAVLRSTGCRDSVTVRLQTERFPRRVYPTFSLPAGDYLALRVTLGRGAGHNWWCVAFPALCLPATAEGLAEAAATAGFSDAENDLLTGTGLQVALKFRILDWLGVLFPH